MRLETDAGRIRAVILTTQRTGSTFLVQCLDSHPQIEGAGELLIGAPDGIPRNPYRGRFKPLYKLLNIAREGAWLPGSRMNRFFTGGEAKVRVFKAMYNQLANPFALRYLRAHEEVRVLHLRRHNLLKVHVSRLLMPKRKRLQATAPVEPVWVHVDPKLAIESIRKARRRQGHFESLFEKHARLPITYESLIDGKFLQAETGRRICEFLDVAQHPMSSRIMKLNPESLREMVTNYDELAEAVSGTEFADMLE